MTGHVSGNPDIVHTAQDPAECACQGQQAKADYWRRLDTRLAATVGVTAPLATTVNVRNESAADISEQHDPDNRDG